jgi:hypothetical protein
MKIIVDESTKTRLDVRIKAVAYSNAISERIKQAVAVYVIADELKKRYGNRSVEAYRDTAIDLVADFLKVEKSTVQDKITRQLDIEMKDFDDKLSEALNGNNEGLRDVYIQHVSSCKRHSGDTKLITKWV